MSLSKFVLNRPSVSLWQPNGGLGVTGVCAPVSAHNWQVRFMGLPSFRRLLGSAGARHLCELCSCVTSITGCSSAAPESLTSQPSRVEAFAQAGAIMLPPCGLQLRLGDPRSVDTDYAPFRQTNLGTILERSVSCFCYAEPMTQYSTRSMRLKPRTRRN